MSDPALTARRDTQRNRQRIVTAAVGLLREGEPLRANTVATRAGLSRATVYRHFATIAALAAEAEPLAAGLPTTLNGEAPGSFDLHTVLEHTPAHRILNAIVAEASRLSGGAPVAVYMVDIDGSRLSRAGGDLGLPEELTIFQAIGPEIPTEHLKRLQDAVAVRLKHATVAPLLVRNRAIGALVALGSPDPGAFRMFARDAAIAVEIGSRFTDEIRRARRHRDTTASAETQQLLLPTRVSHMTDLRFAAHVQPGYDNGGNWFDHAENEDGSWLAAIDTVGSGERASAVSAVALGALHAARNAGSTPADALQAMHAAVRRIGLPGVACSAWVARWHAPSALLFWAAAGDLTPFGVRGASDLTRLAGEVSPPLGGETFPVPPTNHRLLRPDDLVLLLSDGVVGGEYSALDRDAVKALLADTPHDPATVVAAILAAVAARPADLRDDAMAIAFAPAADRT